MSSKPTGPKNSPMIQPTGFGAPFAPGDSRPATTAVDLEHPERIFMRTAAHDVIAKSPAGSDAKKAAKSDSGQHLKEPAGGCFAPLLRRFSGRR